MEREEIRRLIRFVKILAMLMILLIIVELMSCAKARAATITGETQLAGLSKLMQMVIDKNGEIVNQDDLNLLSEVIYWENYHNGYEVMLYTGSVVLNRVEREDFPDTIREVIYQKGQYVTTPKFFTKAIPQECRDIAMHLLLCGSQAPVNVIYQSTHREFGSGVWKVIKGEYFNYE